MQCDFVFVKFILVCVNGSEVRVCLKSVLVKKGMFMICLLTKVGRNNIKREKITYLALARR